VKSTMLVTLWVFIGIEGASVFSGRAERRKDIATATVLGFFTCLALYALVSLLADGELQFCIDHYLEERAQWVEWRGIRIRNWHRP
jgi:hypothetical protein